MKIRILFLSLALLCASLVYAKKSIDSTRVLQTQFKENFTKLMELTYIKNALATSTNRPLHDSIVKLYTDTYFADSVYASRFKRLDSPIELFYTPKVKAFIDFYTFENRQPVEAMLGLAQYYFPSFEKILNDNNLPLVLKYLPAVESSLYPNAISQTGATGLWQLLYPTARIYNLQIDNFVDERREPAKAAEAAVKYLKELFVQYNDWTLAIAAYNSGPANVNKAISRANGKRDFWSIYYYLPIETRDYVPAFMAVVYLMNFYDQHQLEPIKVNYPILSDTIMVNDRLHLGQVAEVLNIPIDQLREINLSYKRDIIRPTGKHEVMNLPKGFYTRFNQIRDSIFNYKDTIFFQPTPTVVVAPVFPKSNMAYATANPYSEPTSYTPPSTDDKTKIEYTVKSGDNIGLIAQWFNVNSEDIRYWNKLSGNKIVVGDEMSVWVSKEKAHVFRKLNTMTFEEKQTFCGKPVKNNKQTEAEVPRDNNYVYYTVRSGDNLWTIAKRYDGVSHEDLIRINNFPKDYKLSPGQAIKIKRK